MRYILLLLLSMSVSASEWKQGDYLPINFLCASLKDAIYIAETLEQGVYDQEITPSCARLPAPLPVRLREIVRSGYTDGTKTGTLWIIEGPSGWFSYSVIEDAKDNRANTALAERVFKEIREASKAIQQPSY